MIIKHIYGECPGGVMVKAMDYIIMISKFEIQGAIMFTFR